MTTLIVVGVIALGILLMFLQLRSISNSNNKLLKQEIPTLQLTIQDRGRRIKKLDLEVNQYEFVLNQQAIPAIIAMSDQIKELGGKPPTVLLTPEEGTFAEQQKKHPN